MIYRSVENLVNKLLNLYRIILSQKQGVCLSTPVSAEQPDEIKQLWVHEIMRVYYDRLVDAGDQTWLFDTLTTTTTKYMGTDFATLFANYDQGSKGKITQDDLRSLMYCDFVPNNTAMLYLKVRQYVFYIMIILLSYIKNMYIL